MKQIARKRKCNKEVYIYCTENAKITKKLEKNAKITIKTKPYV